MNNESMVDIFLEETSSLLDNLDDILLCCEKEFHFNEEYINEIFRIMHSIKGSSAMLGYKSMADISHQIEDMFSYIKNNSFDQKYNESVFNVLFDGCDFLKLQIENIKNGIVSDDNFSELCSKIQSCISLISGYDVNENEDLQHCDSINIPLEVNYNDDFYVCDTKEDDSINNDIDKFIMDEISTYNYDIDSSCDTPYTMVVRFEEGCSMEHLRSFLIIESVEDICDDFSYYPINIENNPDCCDYIIKNGFYIFLNRHSDLRNVEEIIKNNINVKNYEIFEGRLTPKDDQIIKFDEVNVPEIPVSISYDETLNNDESDFEHENTILRNVSQSLISINLSRLDKLMDIVGEIVIAESILCSDPEIRSLKFDSFEKATLNLRKLISELQDNVMSIRMVPIFTLFNKMNRIVRDMSKKLNKNIDLVILDEGTEVDKTIIDSISDPLIHMVRNAVDHGIEKSDERLKNGKNSVGKITLFAKNTGGEIFIVISDDGRGVNFDKILEEADSRGLLSKDKNDYSKDDILSLLLLPGFSTNFDVTEFSGRGIGLDIVKKNVEKIGGTISLTSVEGEGTTIFIKIPVTLAIISGLEISVGSHIYTIPINSVNHSFKALKENIVNNIDGTQSVIVGDECCPVIKLYDLYKIKTDITNIEDGILIYIMINGKGYCIFADKINGERQVVVKSLPKYMELFKIRNCGFAGCTILGNGDVSLILDVYSLIEYYFKKE